jgi:hypothetical protein
MLRFGAQPRRETLGRGPGEPLVPGQRRPTAPGAGEGAGPVGKADPAPAAEDHLTLMVVRILPTVRGTKTSRPQSVAVEWHAT